MSTEHGQTAARRSKRRLVLVLGFTSFYFVVEILDGMLTKTALGLAGVGLALLAIRFADRPTTPERTYGYYRVEILAALTNAVR